MKMKKTNSGAAKSLEIRYLPIDALVPYERNPRTHSEEQIARIAATYLNHWIGIGENLNFAL